MSNVITDISPDTLALAEALLATPIGEMASYETLSKAIDRNVRRQDTRHLLASAIKTVNRDHGAIFENRRGIGYERLPADDTHKVGARARVRIRRSSKAARKRMSRSLEKTNDISDIATRKAYQEMSSLGLIEHLSRDKSVEAAAPADVSEKPLPVAVVAKNFLAHLGAD